MTAATVLAQSAVLLNDPAQSTWTNTVLLPCLTKAGEELEQHFEVNEIPIQKQVSIVINVDTGDTELDEYPTDFVEPISLWEHTENSTEDYVKVREVEFIDMNMDDTDQIVQWAYRNGKIYINPPTTDRDIKLYYVRSMAPLDTTGATVEVQQAKNFLAARTAQIAAANIGNNPSKAASLEEDVTTCLDRLIRRMLKNKQGVGGARRIGYKGARTTRLG